MLTAITEKALEDELIELIEADGAHGVQRSGWSDDTNFVWMLSPMSRQLCACLAISISAML